MGAAACFPGPGRSGHVTTIQHAHERTIQRINKAARAQRLEKGLIEPSRSTASGTPSGPAALSHEWTSFRWPASWDTARVAERHSVHVTESHVAAGFERFLDYQTHHIVESVPAATVRIQQHSGLCPFSATTELHLVSSRV